MRITHVITRLNVGGASRQVVALARAQAEAGHEVVVLHGAVGEDEASLGIDPVAGVRFRFVRGMRREPSGADLAALARVASAVRAERPELVHTHTSKAGLLGRLAAGPRRLPTVVHTYHGHVLSDHFGSRRSRAYRIAERALAKVSDALISLSPTLRDELLELGVGDADRHHVVPPAFDSRPFRDPPDRAAARRMLDLPERSRVVTFVGRLEQIKRPDRFLDAVAQAARANPSVVALIAGDGSLRSGLEDSPAARALGSSLRWLGYRDDLRPVYSASDLVAVTSDREGVPVALLEAQACETEVVTTDAGGASFALPAGHPGLLQDKSPDAIAARLLDRLDQSPDSIRLVELRERVETRFGLAGVSERTLEVYRSAARRGTVR